jgi:hypothetical protein
MKFAPVPPKKLPQQDPSKVLFCSARGHYDTRIDFGKNDLGEVRTNVAAPFSVYPGPDAPTSDLNQTTSR